MLDSLVEQPSKLKCVGDGFQESRASSLWEEVEVDFLFLLIEVVVIECDLARWDAHLDE